jgi:hypothetical protein
MKNKKLLFAILILFISSIFIGCLEPTTPSAIVRIIYKAAENDDYDSFAKYSSFKSSFDEILGFSSIQDLRRNIGKIKYMSEKIGGDTAVVEVEFEYKRTIMNFNIKKVDGLWKYSGYTSPGLDSLKLFQ